MVTIHDKGSDNVRLRSGSCHVMTKKISIWVPICKEKRMKNRGESNFRYRSTLLTSLNGLFSGSPRSSMVLRHCSSHIM